MKLVTGPLSSYKKLGLTDMQFVIPGLPTGMIGFLIAPPDTGKGFVSLSLAYSLAAGLDLIGLNPELKTAKVLYWCEEDGVLLTSARIAEQFERHEAIFDKFSDNIALFDSSLSGDSKFNLNSLTLLAREFDLLIIDTVREAFTGKDEVEDDHLIKSELQYIAKTANIAILAVHHPTKNVTRGLEGLSAVSGSGLSATLANSRLHLYLEAPKGEKKDSTHRVLRHTKSNFLSPEHRLAESLVWNDSKLLVSKDHQYQAMNDLFSMQFNPQISKPRGGKRYKPPETEQEPKTIDLTNAKPNGKNQLRQAVFDRLAAKKATNT